MCGNNPEWVAAVGTWAGAIGQIVVAICATILAFIAYRYSRRQARAAAFQGAVAAVNEFNKVVITSPEAREYVAKLRNHVIGPMEDSIIFIYLNYLEAEFIGFRNGVLDSTNYRESLKNGVHFLRALTRDQMESLLSRGYSRQFRAEVLQEYMDMVK